MATNPDIYPTMPDASPPTVPGRKVAGWLLICGAIVPLAMAARGEGTTPLWVGAAMFAIGGGMAFFPTRTRPAA